MSTPAYIMCGLVAFKLTINALRHNKPIPSCSQTFNFFHAFFESAILCGILFAGGFFNAN